MTNGDQNEGFDADHRHYQKQVNSRKQVSPVILIFHLRGTLTRFAIFKKPAFMPAER